MSHLNKEQQFMSWWRTSPIWGRVSCVETLYPITPTVLINSTFLCDVSNTKFKVRLK